jgi:hypothetical protein
MSQEIRCIHGVEMDADGEHFDGCGVCSRNPLVRDAHTQGLLARIAALEADLEKMTRMATENGDRYSAAEDRVSALAREKYALEAENKALQERLTRALNASGDLSAEFMAERAARLRAEEERDEAWVIRKATRTREIEANRARNEAMAEVGRLRAAARYALTCHEDVACSCDGCARLHAALAPVQAEERKVARRLKPCVRCAAEGIRQTLTVDRGPEGEPLCDDHGGTGPGAENGERR